MKKYLKIIFIAYLGCSLTSCDEDSSDIGGVESNVTGGSLNRFTVSGDYLYVINDKSLIPFSLANPEKPIKEDELFIGRGIETLISRGDNLFIGADDGMHIYDISDRQSPRFLSTYRHVISCDPVAVQGNYAYVTLRTGTTGCWRGENVLEIVDIRDLRNPRNVFTQQMSTPHGLAVDNENLFVTQGAFGMTRFRLTDPTTPVVKSLIDSLNVNDAIARNNNLILTGLFGVYQYDYSDSLKLLSKISF